MLTIPENVKTAKNIVIATLVLSFLSPLLLPKPSPQDFVSGIGGVLITILVCYNFYKGKNWARIWFLIGTIIATLFMLFTDFEIHSQPYELHSNVVVFFVALHFLLVLQIYAAVLLFTDESNFWFREMKHRKSQQDYINSQRTNYQREYSYDTNYSRNQSYNEANQNYQSYNIVINCPRCSQKLRVPGDRVVIAKCSRCGLEFKTNS